MEYINAFPISLSQTNTVNNNNHPTSIKSNNLQEHCKSQTLKLFLVSYTLSFFPISNAKSYQFNILNISGICHLSPSIAITIATTTTQMQATITFIYQSSFILPSHFPSHNHSLQSNENEIFQTYLSTCLKHFICFHCSYDEDQFP